MSALTCGVCGRMYDKDSTGCSHGGAVTPPPNPPRTLKLAGQGYAATTDAADDAPAVPPQVPAGEPSKHVKDAAASVIDIPSASTHTCHIAKTGPLCLGCRDDNEDEERIAPVLVALFEAGRKAGRVEGLEEAEIEVSHEAAIREFMYLALAKDPDADARLLTARLDDAIQAWECVKTIRTIKEKA